MFKQHPSLHICPETTKQQRNAWGKKTNKTHPAQIFPSFPRQTFVEDSHPLPSLKLRARSWFWQDGVPKQNDCLPTIDFPFLLSTTISRNVVVTSCNLSHRSWNVVGKKLETTTTVDGSEIWRSPADRYFIPSFTRVLYISGGCWGILPSTVWNRQPVEFAAMPPSPRHWEYLFSAKKSN